MTKTRIFIGSSTEGIPLAQAIQQNLESDFDCEIWNQDIFKLGNGVLESLCEMLDVYDFAILALTPDDITNSREREQDSPRDNVIFELGLFIGGLGRNRAIAIHEQGMDLKLPSDLFGIISARFRTQAHGNLVSSTGAACGRIATHIRKIGNREHINVAERRVDIVLEKGDTRSLDVAADAALYLGEKRQGYMDELRRHLISGDPVPSKYLYWTDYASTHWLQLCEKESYGFYRESLRNLADCRVELVDALLKRASVKELDFVSLGCGDGKKDLELILELTSRLSENEQIHYYPIDISETLLVEAIRTATGRGVPRSKLKLQAILGDYTQLKKYEIAYEYRAQNNLFSILGNSLGNADEGQIIECLANALHPKDFVLIEANIGDADRTLNTSVDDIYMEHDFSPLAILGTQFDKDLIHYDVVDGISNIGSNGSTRTVRARYDRAKVKERSVENVTLSLVHHYDLDSLISALEKDLKIDIFFRKIKGDVALLLGQRP